jgi:hypothetical protein
MLCNSKAQTNGMCTNAVVTAAAAKNYLAQAWQVETALSSQRDKSSTSSKQQLCATSMFTNMRNLG